VTTILTSHGQRYHCGVGGSGQQPFICFEREERFNEYKSIIQKGMAWGLNPLKLKTVFSHALSLSLLMYHYHCSFSSLAAKREGHVSICFLRLQSVLQFSNFSIYLMLADAGSALAGASRAKHSGKEITWEKLHSHLASFS
jgi:hypothetical protein